MLLAIGAGICAFIVLKAFEDYIFDLVMWLFPVAFVKLCSSFPKTRTFRGSSTVAIFPGDIPDWDPESCDISDLVDWKKAGLRRSIVGPKIKMIYDVIADNPVKFRLDEIDCLAIHRKFKSILMVSFGRELGTYLHVELNGLENNVSYMIYILMFVVMVGVQLFV